MTGSAARATGGGGSIAAGAGGGRIEHVGAVKRVVKAAPARIGGIQHEPVVECGNDELRARHRRDFGVDILRADFEPRRFGNEIADFGKECLIGGHVGDRPRMGPVPGIELRLNGVALREQGTVDRHKAAENVGKARPKRVGLHAGSGQGPGFDEIGKRGRYLQSAAVHIF